MTRTPRPPFAGCPWGAAPALFARLEVPTTLLQASDSVKHMCLPCHWTQRGSIVADFVRSYGSSGRTIVFCDTKKDVNELVTSLADTCGAQALHGDIPQVLACVCESQNALGKQAHLWQNMGRCKTTECTEQEEAGDSPDRHPLTSA